MVLALASLLHVTSLATIVAHHVLVNAAPGDNVLFNATAVACISTVLHGNITLVRRARRLHSSCAPAVARGCYSRIRLA